MGIYYIKTKCSRLLLLLRSQEQPSHMQDMEDMEATDISVLPEPMVATEVTDHMVTMEAMEAMVPVVASVILETSVLKETFPALVHWEASAAMEPMDAETA